MFYAFTLFHYLHAPNKKHVHYYGHGNSKTFLNEIGINVLHFLFDIKVNVIK